MVVSQLSGELTQCTIARRQLRLAPVVGDCVDERIGLGRALKRAVDLFPEVVRMRLYSVETVELGRDDGCE